MNLNIVIILPNIQFVKNVYINDKPVKYAFNTITKKLTILSKNEGEIKIEA